ncbi:hypothetical protein KFK09_009042 [Dendrobium nobile]|uniref:Nitrate transporter n=1 Tax=Dendrobium nobile TaxID=94219 RepID=A0A8T3BPC4_DENNO|nr:hypothetical protein KFK09_009042 [Dendrobium nobile]
MKRPLADLLSYLIRRPSPPPSPSPPPEEMAEKQKRKHSGWKCMPYIIGNETFEKLAGAGLLANFTVYLVSEFHMEQVKAANVVNIFFGTTNFAPLIGAFLSDAYAGRFNTLAFSSVISFLGMLTLTLSAAVPQLRPPRCSSPAANSVPCPTPSGLHLGVLYLSMALLVVGAGGIRPCSLPFGVDQFDRTSEKDREGLKRFFNWYYFTSTLALFIAMTVMVYVQNSISWSIGFGIPTSLMLLALILFFLGTPLYVHVPPNGSVFSGIAQVFVAAFHNRRLPLPSSTAALYNPISHDDRYVTPLPLTHSFTFLTKAAILSPSIGLPPSSWRLCTLQQVEEVKCLIRIVPIWASGIICFVALGQQWTFAVLQSLKMNRHLGPHFKIPPGSVGTIAMLGLTFFIPVYDMVIVPVARRITKLEGGITLLQRQGVGLLISILSMVAAAMVEKKRREKSLEGVAISVLWLMPPLLVMGVAEAFNGVGQIEFYNRQFPEHMQTLAGSLFFCSLAGASYLSSLLISVVRKATDGGGRRSWLEDDIDKGRLDYFYYLIAGMGVVNLIYFVICASFYRYKGVEEVKVVKEGGGDGDIEVCKVVKSGEL